LRAIIDTLQFVFESGIVFFFSHVSFSGPPVHPDTAGVQCPFPLSLVPPFFSFWLDRETSWFFFILSATRLCWIVCVDSSVGFRVPKNKTSSLGYSRFPAQRHPLIVSLERCIENFRFLLPLFTRREHFSRRRHSRVTSGFHSEYFFDHFISVVVLFPPSRRFTASPPSLP